MRKFFRLLKRDPLFLLRTLIVCGSLVFIIYEIKIIQFQSQQYKEIKEEEELVRRIPEMEKKMRAHMIRPVAARPEKVITIEFVLQGTSLHDGIPYAVIDEHILKTGDMIGDYQLMEINRGSVLLQNPDTNEIKELHLPIPKELEGKQ